MSDKFDLSIDINNEEFKKIREILLKNSSNALRHFVLEILDEKLDVVEYSEYQKLEQENEELNQKYLNAVSDYEQEKFKVEELKKQLQIKDYGFNVVNEEFRECAEENLKLLNQQLKFIKYLKDKEKQFDIIGDSINSGVCCGILKKYKEIIKYEQN